jgi:tetratricopeptide (TPR) repeat protein
MSTSQVEERVGEAWKQHRMGNNPAAIEIFEEVLNRRPDHIDALYGLGLARRANGETAWAVEAFKKALALSTEFLNAQEKASKIDGHLGSNDLSTYDDDRYMMLSRMLKQRLDEVES